MSDSFEKTFVPLSSGEPPVMPNQSTRIFLLRDLDGNPRTRAEIENLIKTPAEALFEYARNIPTPGLAYALADNGQRVRTLAHVAAQTGIKSSRFASMVLGRHSHTDAPTEAYNLALRHLVLTQPALEPGVLEVRDLRSTAGTRAMSGARLQSARLSAPLALDLGDLFLIAAVTPLTMDQAAYLDRIYTPKIDALPRPATSVGLRLERFRKLGEDRRATDAGVKDEDAEPESGSALRLEEMVEVTPTIEQLMHGFMIGRYARCDWPGQIDGAPSGLSRVHAMVFGSDRGAYIVDTGSTNGLRHGKKGCLRYKHLELGDQFWLGKACRLTVVEPRLGDASLKC